jgi:hypothetical protein
VDKKNRSHAFYAVPTPGPSMLVEPDDFHR